MKPNDHIENFFRSRLADVKPAPDAWNIPSENLWNTAKNQFPKEKNRKIRGIWFLGILLAIALAGGMWITGVNEEPPKYSGNAEFHVTSRKQKKTAELVVKHNIPSPGHLLNDNKIPFEGIKPMANTSSTSEVQIPTTHKIDSYARSPRMPDKNLAIKKNSLVQVPSWTDRNANEGTLSNHWPENEIVTNKILPVEVNIEPHVGKHFNSLPLPALSISSTRAPVELSIQSEIKNNRSYIRKWEIGLSHAPFVFGIKGLFEDEEFEGDHTSEISHRFYNVNMSVARRIHPKWSISTGLSYSQLLIDYAFTEVETYRNTFAKRSLQSIVGNGNINGSIALDETSENVLVEFLDDVDLTRGDRLVVKGLVPINIHLVQVPVILNYHLAKKRWEWLFQAGLTIDYVHSAIDQLDISLFKENQLVTKPAKFSPIQESQMGITPYLGAGIRHHITRRFNFGINSRIGPASLGFDVGLYYRFNRARHGP